eukprot:28405-Amphidinium_carterae.1
MHLENGGHITTQLQMVRVEAMGSGFDRGYDCANPCVLKGLACHVATNHCIVLMGHSKFVIGKFWKSRTGAKLSWMKVEPENLEITYKSCLGSSKGCSSICSH